MTERRAACLNCGASLTGEYCASCGQRDADPRVSVRDMAHEFVAEHFGLESKVASTIGTLVLHPGRITREFFEGRRARYIPPLRLYLSSSVLFFLLLATFGGRARTVTSPNGVHLTLDSLSAADSSGAIRKALADTTDKQKFEHRTDSMLAIKPGDNAVVSFSSSARAYVCTRW